MLHVACCLMHVACCLMHLHAGWVCLEALTLLHLIANKANFSAALDVATNPAMLKHLLTLHGADGQAPSPCHAIPNAKPSLTAAPARLPTYSRCCRCTAVQPSSALPSVGTRRQYGYLCYSSLRRRRRLSALQSTAACTCGVGAHSRTEVSAAALS